MREHTRDCHKWPATWLDNASLCTCGADDYNAGYAAGTAQAEAAEKERDEARALAQEACVALARFKAEEWSVRADWQGFCPMRRANLRCKGTDGHSSPLGTPHAREHDESCPWRGLDATLTRARALSLLTDEDEKERKP